MHSLLDWQPSMSGSRMERWTIGLFLQPTLYAALLLFALAALLGWRRIAGAIHEPLPAAGLLLAGVVLSLLLAIVHWSSALFTAQKRFRLFSDIALTLSLLAVAAALSLPGSPAWALSLFWLLLLLEEGWSWRTHFFRDVEKLKERTCRREGLPREGEAPAEPPLLEKITPKASARQEPRPPGVSPSVTSPTEFSDVDLDEPLLPEEVTQQLTRSMAADGTEELAGLLRVPFVAGQRTTSVHLAFCPPFAHTPELSVEQIEGPEARIKAMQVLPYGARLDLKLHAASESRAAVILQFSARSKSEGIA